MCPRRDGRELPGVALEQYDPVLVVQRHPDDFAPGAASVEAELGRDAPNEQPVRRLLVGLTRW